MAALTYEESRLMLGVRRGSVTDALHKLEEEQAIHSVRGRVIVRDRSKLLELASGTYGFAEAEDARLLDKRLITPRRAFYGGAQAVDFTVE